MNNPEQNIAGWVNLPNYGLVIGGVESLPHEQPVGVPEPKQKIEPAPPPVEEPPVDAGPRWRGTVSVAGFELEDRRDVSPVEQSLRKAWGSEYDANLEALHAGYELLAKGDEQLFFGLPDLLLQDESIRAALVVLGSGAPGEETSHETLRAEWGGQYEENATAARVAAQFLFAKRQELLDAINGLGYGNDKRLIKALVAFGKHLSQKIEL